LFPRETGNRKEGIVLTHTLGFPRVGLDRELKKALESHWKGELGEAELLAVASDLRQRHWQLQQSQGIDLIPAGDFSLYDHMLDTTAMLGAVPQRYGWKGGQVDLATYFRMARGEGPIAAMEMSKWFDTNYHYLVPEFYPGQSFTLASTKLTDQVAEAKALGIRAKPVLVGPLTYLKLGKSMSEGFDQLDHLDGILAVYEQILRQLAGQVEWIQIDEPALVLDLSEREKRAFKVAYERLTKAAGSTKILLATYFDSLRENAALACFAGIAALHIDLVRAPRQLNEVLTHLGRDQMLSLGIVNGRNVWRVDADAALALIQDAVAAVGADRILIGSSCSLLHSPVDLDGETKLDSDVLPWLAFAKQKCEELRLLADAASGRDVRSALEAIRGAWRLRRGSSRVINPRVRQRISAITASMARRATPHDQRKAKQHAHLSLPPLPTTTIGSFPQTAEVRKARSDFKSGKINTAAYTEAIHGFIQESVDRQHELGLDVLVHGEAERNDMVEYFGEQLEGICFTQNGWVQSYGSRCVKPPIIFGDVSRPRPMTVEWTKYAQSLTKKPMKGMLTGPVTILCWSFVRDDQPRSETCRQIALAIRDEVQDLEKAGIAVIQVDEAALREGLPLRRSDWNDYLGWAVESFKLATSGVRDETQLHTHMCYSEFNDIVDWIAKMDADVISIEASRSKMELLKAFKKFNYPNDIGPGIYDIHSPRVPSAEEMSALLKEALDVIPADRLWVNPDCGLKTRAWPETLASLQNMMTVATAARAELT
jgi:5-methyltetrahydropteroyltriglutamate--homocysteine methyltransferase